MAGDPFLVLVPLLAGAFYVLRSASTLERSFWIVVLAVIALSAAIVLMSDGWRLLFVTHLFIAAFLTLGFAAPSVGIGNRPMPAVRWQSGAAVLAARLLVFLAFPAVAHALAERELRAHPPIPGPQVFRELVTGGRRMSGFIVIPDGTPRSYEVPELHVSEFVKIVRKSHLESDFGPFLDEVLLRVPFAFIGTGRMDGANFSNIYIVPGEILERKDVWAWQFTVRNWAPGEKRWSILTDVVTAEPIP